MRGQSLGARPPTIGTSTISSSETALRSAQPYFFLSRSASVIGARSTTARSLVKWSPPIGMTAVWAIVPFW